MGPQSYFANLPQYILKKSSKDPKVMPVLMEKESQEWEFLPISTPSLIINLQPSPGAGGGGEPTTHLIAQNLSFLLKRPGSILY